MALQEKYLNPFTELLEAAEIGKFNREELEQYENSLKHYRDNKNVVDTATIVGEARGEAKGERKKAIEVARNALAEGFPVSVIAKLTGLSEEEVAALQSSSPS